MLSAETVRRFPRMTTHRVYANAPEPETRLDAARALYNKATTLGLHAEWEAAVAVCDELVAAFGDATEAGARLEAAQGLLAKATYLRGMRRYREVFYVGRELARRYRDDPDPATRATANSLNPVYRFRNPSPPAPNLTPG